MTGRRIALATLLLLLPLAALLVSQMQAQSVKPPTDPELFKIIQAQDAALFDSYNKCDLEKFSSFFSDDVEFYHDNGGVTLGRQALTDSVKKNICGQTTRELVPGTLEVFRIAGYGALEIGVHRFNHPNSNPPIPQGEGRFVHLWHYKDGVWKVTRVFSFNHHEAGK